MIYLDLVTKILRLGLIAMMYFGDGLRNRHAGASPLYSVPDKS
jgi:hypothetical protein